MYGSVMKNILRNPIDGGGDPNDCEDDNEGLVHLNSCYRFNAKYFSLLKSLTNSNNKASTKHLRYVKQFS